jgi:hypothetical protein
LQKRRQQPWRRRLTFSWLERDLPVANVVPCTQFEAYPFKRPNRRETQSFVKSGARRVWQDDSGENAVKSL